MQSNLALVAAVEIFHPRLSQSTSGYNKTIKYYNFDVKFFSEIIAILLFQIQAPTYSPWFPKTVKTTLQKIEKIIKKKLIKCRLIVANQSESSV